MSPLRGFRRCNMKKKILIIMTLVLVAVTATSLFACKDDVSDVTMEAIYNAAVENGFEGTLAEYLEYLKGDSAYEIAIQHGFSGTEAEWLASLQGTDGADGKNASLTPLDFYNEAVKQGFVGSYSDFLNTYFSYSSENTQVNANSLFASVSVYCNYTITYTITQGGGFGIGGFSYGGWSRTYTEPASSAGSGVIFSMNKEAGSAYIITNHHVVYNESSITANGISDDIHVYLYGSEIIGNETYSTSVHGTSAPSYTGMGIEATYVGGSKIYDIAVLEIKNSEILKNSNAVTVEFSDSNELLVGQKAIAVGNAEGEGISVTSGVVSVDSENIYLDSTSSSSTRVIRIDTAVNSGNSGGGLFNADGKLLGIVNAKSVEENVDNIGYALPSNVVKYVVDNILYYQDKTEKSADVQKCMLGITIWALESSAVLDGTGNVRIEEKVTVDGVDEKGLAYGSLQKGDILTEVSIQRSGSIETEKYAVNRTFVIVDLMLTMRVGDTLTMTYMREGVEGTATFVMTDACISEIG